MANVKWNAQQQQAIDARNGTILVSAAAGSGKTAVLVERVIQMLTDKSANIKADQLLIVTFTNLAAEEMRIRINKRITQLLDQCTVDSNLDEEPTAAFRACPYKHYRQLLQGYSKNRLYPF